jgi:hypothetical protein
MELDLYLFLFLFLFLNRRDRFSDQGKDAAGAARQSVEGG